MKHEMTAVAFLGLIAGGRFSHGVMGRCAAVLSVGFDAVPSNHENDSAGVFDTRKEFDVVRTGIVSLLEDMAEDFDVFWAFSRLYMLDKLLLSLCRSFSGWVRIRIDTRSWPPTTQRKPTVDARSRTPVAAKNSDAMRTDKLTAFPTVQPNFCPFLQRVSLKASLSGLATDVNLYMRPEPVSSLGKLKLSKR